MTPEQLADEIAEHLGGHTVDDGAGETYVILKERWWRAGAFLEDPGVAMAVAALVVRKTAVQELSIQAVTHSTANGTRWRVIALNSSAHAESTNLPRAINEACAAALREGK